MNIPNALSIFRMILVPVFAVVFFSENPHAYQWATFVFAFAGLTDVIDGYIARKYNQITMLGRILDPLADKLMVFAALLCMTFDGLIPIWLCIVFFSKEFVQCLGGLVLFKKIHDMPASNLLGKTATVLFYAAIASIILGENLPYIYKNILIWIAVIIMMTAFFSYLFRAIQLVSDKPSVK